MQTNDALLWASLAGLLDATIRTLRAEAWREDASFVLVFADQRYSLRLRQVFDRSAQRDGRNEWADRVAEALKSGVSGAGYTLVPGGDGPVVHLPPGGSSAVVLFSWSRALHRLACNVVFNGLRRLSVGRRCGSDVAFSALVPQ